MFERFAVGARAAVTASAEEARRRGDRRIGTDHLLMGLLHDADTADVLGVTVEAAREKSAAMDRDALAAIGIDLGGYSPSPKIKVGIRTPFTSGSRAVMERTLRLTTAEKSRRIAPKHLMLALLERQQPDPAATLLAELGVDRAEVTRRLSQ